MKHHEVIGLGLQGDEEALARQVAAILEFDVLREDDRGESRWLLRQDAAFTVFVFNSEDPDDEPEIDPAKYPFLLQVTGHDRAMIGEVAAGFFARLKAAAVCPMVRLSDETLVDTFEPAT